jgi:hypothetical protein
MTGLVYKEIKKQDGIICEVMPKNHQKGGKI